MNRDDALMPYQHHAADTVADICERILGRFGQCLARRQVVTISRQPEGSHFEVGNQPVARPVAAGLGDIEGELSQGFP